MKKAGYNLLFKYNSVRKTIVFGSVSFSEESLSLSQDNLGEEYPVPSS